jgi:hypothetical protein
MAILFNCYFENGHVGMVLFDLNATISFYLDSYLSNSAVYNAIRNTTYSGGGTAIAPGMLMAINQVCVYW